MNEMQEQIAEQNGSLRAGSPAHPEAAISEPAGGKEIDRIQRTLSAVLGSVQFRSSKQCQDLLRYVVEQSLKDQSDLLRERVIGAAIFGRRPDYDTANDPIVRARMAEVRKRLAQYYQSDRHDSSQTHIEIPPGHYRAIFRSVGAPASASPEENVVPELVKAPAAVETISAATEMVPLVAEPAPALAAGPGWKWNRWWLLVAVGLVASIVAAGVRLASKPESTAFDQFWAPVLNNPMPVIVYTGTNVVYRFTPKFLEQYRKLHHLDYNGPEFGVDLASMNVIDAQNLQISKNAYVTVGDVSAATAITSRMVQLKKPYELRFAQDISPGDLHSAPIVLLGAFNNEWTLNTTNPLRFSFAGGDTIKDAFDPRRAWQVNVKPDGSTTDDYAIISRLLSSDRSGTRMTAAGIGQYGTQAAAEFLSSPEKINAFARTLPARWNSKNLQIVIHVKVVDDVPASAEIVAAHQW